MEKKEEINMSRVYIKNKGEFRNMYVANTLFDKWRVVLTKHGNVLLQVVGKHCFKQISPRHYSIKRDLIFENENDFVLFLEESKKMFSKQKELFLDNYKRQRKNDRHSISSIINTEEYSNKEVKEWVDLQYTDLRKTKHSNW